MEGKAVFIDRDGVINQNRGDHVKSWAEFRFLPGTLEALALLAPTDLRIFIVTNQAIINRGVVLQQVVDGIHQQMINGIAKAGGRVDAVIYCPHTPAQDCDCRKPRPGLLYRAAQEYVIDLNRSYLIGDSVADIAAGHAAGCRSILVLTGRGCRQFISRAARQYEGYKVRWNLLHAVKTILQMEGYLIPHTLFTTFRHFRVPNKW